MDAAIKSLKSTTFSGRRLTRRQIAEIRDIVGFLPGTSRNRLCRLICEQLNWVSARGDLRIGACLSMLEKLERRGILTLPPRRSRASAAAWTAARSGPPPPARSRGSRPGSPTSGRCAWFRPRTPKAGSCGTRCQCRSKSAQLRRGNSAHFCFW